jgi:hypothetical protein
MNDELFTQSLNIEYALSELVKYVSAGDFSLSLPFTILYALWYVFMVLSIVASIIFIILYVKNMMAYALIEKEMRKRFETKSFKELDTQSDKNRYLHVVSLLESVKPSDWRQALIECDIMLDEILVEQACMGKTLDERLASAVSKKVESIDEAVLAHAVRKQLSDEAFVLTDALALQTFKQYEKVFKKYSSV